MTDRHKLPPRNSDWSVGQQLFALITGSVDEISPRLILSRLTPKAPQPPWDEIAHQLQSRVANEMRTRMEQVYGPVENWPESDAVDRLGNIETE